MGAGNRLLMNCKYLFDIFVTSKKVGNQDGAYTVTSAPYMTNRSNPKDKGATK